MIERESQAVWFTAARRVQIRQEIVQQPAPGEVQVRAIHSLISSGSEMNLYRGEGNLPDVLLPTAKGQIPFPISFGYQVVGEVVSVGDGVDRQVGDRVLAVHPHQSLFNIPGRLTWRIPSGISLLQAQFQRMFGVGLHTQLQRPVRPGEVVVVSGLGLIGSFTAHLARMSAGKLVLIDPVAKRRQAASKWISADAIVAPEEADQAIHELSHGIGADLFIETSGAPPALQCAINNTAVLGTIAVSAWYGTRPVSLSLSPEFHLRSLKILSIHGFNLDEGNRWPEERKVRTSFDFLKGIDVEPLITHRMPFGDAQRAYQLLDEQPGEALAVLLDY